MLRARRALGAVAGFGALALGIGCNQTDRDCLKRAARHIADRLDPMRQNARVGLENGPLVSEPLTPVGKVRVRVQGDRYLRHLGLRIGGEGSSVTLAGEVPDEAHRIRAVELAQSTVGVEQVVDELTLHKSPSPP